MPIPTITGPQITSRVTSVLTALTPSVAPTILFVHHTDNTCKLEHYTEPGRMRLIQVTLEDPRISVFAASVLGTTNFDKLLKVRVGYSLQDFEEIDGVSVSTEEMKTSDLELIRRTLDATTTVFPVATYPGIKRILFDTVREVAGGKCRDITYGISFGRVT